MSSLLSPSTYNISILSIPIFHFLSFFPHAYALTLAKNSFPDKKWDNRNPRGSSMKEKISKLPPETRAAFERAEACSANGFENLPIYMAAVALGNFAGLEQGTLDRFAILSVLGRVLYTWLYVNNTTQGLAGMRSLTWVFMTGMNWRMFYLAAKALAGK